MQLDRCLRQLRDAGVSSGNVAITIYAADAVGTVGEDGDCGDVASIGSWVAIRRAGYTPWLASISRTRINEFVGTVSLVKPLVCKPAHDRIGEFHARCCGEEKLHLHIAFEACTVGVNMEGVFGLAPPFALQASPEIMLALA